MMLALLGAGAGLVLSVVGLCVYLLYRWLLPKPIPGFLKNLEAARRVLGDAPDMLREVSVTGEFGVWYAAQVKKMDSPVCRVFIRPFAKPWVLLADFRRSRDNLMRRHESDKPKFIEASTHAKAHVPYLDAVIEEGTRLNAFTVRWHAPVDTQILGYPIPKGTEVTGIHGFQRAGIHGAAPPSRQCKAHRVRPGAAAGIWTGTAGLLGRRLAVLEMRTVVATLIWTFEMLETPEFLSNYGAAEGVARALDTPLLINRYRAAGAGAWPKHRERLALQVDMIMIMLVDCGAKQHTRAEFETLLKEADSRYEIRNVLDDEPLGLLKVYLVQST
ncbi:hypothetical protein F5Y14DRAFT_451272 [Nemania sp. NC0429]|nr:hypothetical protein F5Y14DRAFT_451272 [Nemania sp. NC0429]